MEPFRHALNWGAGTFFINVDKRILISVAKIVFQATPHILQDLLVLAMWRLYAFSGSPSNKMQRIVKHSLSEVAFLFFSAYLVSSAAVVRVASQTEAFPALVF